MEKHLSFQVHIDKNRQSFPHEDFFVVDVLVVVCGFFVRISHNINRSRLHTAIGFGLSWFR